MIILPRTDDKRQLAAIYSVVDVFSNPSWGDNYLTVNLEADTNGATADTFPIGVCAETIGLNVDSTTAANVDSAAALFKVAAQRRPPEERRSYEL